MDSRSVQIGYALIGEEHGPNDLLQNAKIAEEAGFKFALISDHYHPWIDNQGQSPFAWTVLGALSQVTKIMEIGTGVTCPIMRYHPAIIAQAAATSATMMPGRFFLGVGTGENLNEHILAKRWPDYDMRAEMLEEAIKLIKLLWKGETTTFYGKYYEVENARIYTMPKEMPKIMVAASGKSGANLAGKIGDGLITTSPDPELINSFESSGAKNRPLYAYMAICFADNEEKAIKLALKQWPNAVLPGELGQELKTPKHFEQASELVSEKAIDKTIICGSDASRHIEAIHKYIKAGFNRIFIHQIGRDQKSAIDFYQKQILPNFN